MTHSAANSDVAVPDAARGPFQKAILVIGSLGGLGYLPASGTVTVAVLGVPMFWLMEPLSWTWQVLILLPMFAVSVWLSAAGDRILGEKDSRKMVVDEIVGYGVAIIALPFTWPVVIVSFFVERIIDIVKVPPASWIEDHVPGGWGVVLDDVVAGLYTLGLMHVLIRVAPGLMGLGAS